MQAWGLVSLLAALLVCSSVGQQIIELLPPPPPLPVVGALPSPPPSPPSLTSPAPLVTSPVFLQAPPPFPSDPFDGQYICRQVLVCVNGPSEQEALQSGEAALEAVRWLVNRQAKDNTRVLSRKGCITPGCCCQFPISVALWVQYQSQDQLTAIDNWVLGMKNGTYNHIFPNASCVVDNSDAFSETSPKCLQPDPTPGFPVVCRELLGCSLERDRQVALDSINSVVLPWFTKWNYTDQQFAQYFMPTIVTREVLSTDIKCNCSFVISMAFQVPVDPKNIVVNVAMDLDEYLANNLKPLPQFGQDCPLRNNSRVYADVHRDTCDLPEPIVASPPPPGLPSGNIVDPTTPFCAMFLICADQPDWPWPAGQLMTALKPTFQQAGLDPSPPLLEIKQLDGNIVSFEGKTCTCSLTGTVHIKIEAVSARQSFLLSTGLKQALVPHQGVLTDFECIMDASKQFIADTPQCQITPTPPVAQPPLPPTPPTPLFPPGSIISNSPPPPSSLPFDCSLQMRVCDNSIDYAWTDTKMRLTADACISKMNLTNIRYTSGELDFYQNCKCNFPGFMTLLFPAQGSTDAQKDELMGCISVSLQQNYKDTVCVEAETSASCYNWQQKKVVNGENRRSGGGWIIG